MTNTIPDLTPALEAHRSQDTDACLAEVAPVLKTTPHHPVALHLKAWAYSKTGKSQEALEILSEVIDENPKLAAAQAEYGSILMDTQRHAEALQPLREASEQQPERAELSLKYAACLLKNNQIAKAEALLSQLLERIPNHPQAQYLLAVALLQNGRWCEGFEKYRIRSWLESSERTPAEVVEWTGGSLEGQSILIRAEGSPSDQILFSRYARWVRDSAEPETVLLLASEETAELLARVDGIDRVITDLGDAEYDRWVSMSALPHLYGTEPGELPFGDTDYLAGDASSDLAERFAGEGQTIGVAWRSDEASCCSLKGDELEQLLSWMSEIFKGAEIVAIQPDLTRPERKMLKRHQVKHLGKEIADLADAGSAMTHMDLVVSTDMAIAHTAGAMGKPVWNIQTPYADWRWSQDGDYTAWYPNMRLLPAAEQGDWSSLEGVLD